MNNIPVGTKVILLDIFGTTTPVSFIHTTLASYVKEHLYELLAKFHSIPEIKSSLADLKRMHTEDTKGGLNPPSWNAGDPESNLKGIIGYCNWLIGQGSNASPLRYIEDFVWEEGYRSGELRGEVYSEVPEVMLEWKASGLEICTYSADNVYSQQLIFATTKFGDLMPLIRGYFDTSVGNKNDPRSYVQIAGILGVKSNEILFFSSSVEEAFAARKAGLNVVLMIRDKNAIGGKSEGIPCRPDLSVFTEI